MIIFKFDRQNDPLGAINEKIYGVNKEVEKNEEKVY